MIYLRLFVILGLLFGCRNMETQTKKGKKIVIELELSDEIVHPRPANFQMKKDLEIVYRPVLSVDNNPPWNSTISTVNDYKVRWELYAEKPIEMNYGFGKLCLVNPGDSIKVEYNDDEATYSGKGSHKLTTWSLILEEAKRLGLPTKGSFKIDSVEDFLEWDHYLDQKILIQMAVLDAHRNKIQNAEFEFLKALVFNLAETDRLSAFKSLRRVTRKNQLPGIHPSDLNAIWDSTNHKPWSQWFWSPTNRYCSIYTLFDYNRLQVSRKFNFDLESIRDSAKSGENISYLYYTNAKENFRGLVRERLLVHILDEIYLDAWGPDSPSTRLVLSDYYKQPGFPEYKNWVKNLEKLSREKN